MERELKELAGQKERLHELLERGVYDIDTYLERSQKIAEQLEQTKKLIWNTEKSLAEEKRRQKAHIEIIPRVEQVLDLYYETEDPAKKNDLLKTVLEYATYRKEKHQNDDDFTLVLSPRIQKTTVEKPSSG